ncbi:aldo/keto reductase [Halioxenophilus aromaticivorans]|uniref:Aldo/keto reductase n=1 Tax=Halioxenophilus aromaticivorans TaxID=1306992 RepID=A0AAV3TZA8_9ALTE
MAMNRRQFLYTGACAAAALALPSRSFAVDTGLQTKPISPGKPAIPVIGMGTWQTFNIGDDPQLQKRCTEIVSTFIDMGGQLIDSSPMYGSSATTVGRALAQLGPQHNVFAADKIWSRDGDATQQEYDQQARRWGRDHMELMQIHNLMAWQPHLEHLSAMKQAGLVDYIGVTTSHGRRHKELENIMANHALDFVQLTYNISHRDVEQRLLPLAREKNIAVIANRPYDGGHLIKPLKHKAAVPQWAQQEHGYQTWADLLLGFVVSHPAVTCAIPATSQVAHMRENMQAGRHTLLSAKERRRLADYVGTL